ncbi:DHA2 family efflux MFS transporter permease subunit [Fictibacillus sp. KIGAM418]|uniref:DHA2 family efflux MFS transporter permease subunit n=1 Tax=Fictibacillus marinisediminis TaxID=2878389 RepID=A0A9X2BF43_9BACL|nr:DHA2 family efflux MFS transporter permease subunit [Fictibacillus marinisediminis]MCK6259316.1 DHA2 family efflux MFS transporter permease subunit [Fictibacillus marinisediminis]
MSIYLTGYVILCVILLLTVNYMAIRSKRKKQAEDTELITERASGHPEESNILIDETLEDTAISEPALEYVTSAAEQQAEERSLQRTESVKKDEPIHVGKILTVLMLGAFIAILNQTLLNVAIPHIMNDLNVSANTVQWISTGYMLVNGVCIPITAYLIEKFGTRTLFITAMLLFTAGAVICSLSASFGMLMAGRVVQAVGAGIIMPLMMTIFLTVFPIEKRGQAMGTMGIAMLFAPAIGPTLSGYIVENYSWRLLFDIIIPFGVIDLIIAFVWMKDVIKKSSPKFDFPGFLFSTLGFGFLLYGFSEAGNKGWTSSIVLSSIIIGIISLVAFTFRELTTDKPMLDLRVFKYDVFALTTVISMIINMAMFAAMILLPIYLQNIRGFTPFESGLLLLPGAIIMGIMSPISGALFDRIGARPLAIVGLTITFITTWAFSHLSTDTTYGHILFLYVSRMFGMSFLMMTVMTAGMNQLPRHLNSHGTATSNTMRQVAGSLGTAFLVTVFSNRQEYHMADYSNVVTSANPYIADKLSALGQGLAQMAGLPGGAGSSLGVQVIYGTAAKQAAIDGINDSFMVATGIAVIALILSFFIKRVIPPTK